MPRWYRYSPIGAVESRQPGDQLGFTRFGVVRDGLRDVEIARLRRSGFLTAGLTGTVPFGRARCKHAVCDEVDARAVFARAWDSEYFGRFAFRRGDRQVRDLTRRRIEHEQLRWMFAFARFQ